MAIDPITNFVRGQLTSSVSNSTNTFPVGDASAFPDPANGEYNLVAFDAATYDRPSADPAVEIVRVTARDTSADELTVSRGQENTTAEPHPDTTVLHQAITASVVSQIDTALTGVSETGIVKDTADFNEASVKQATITEQSARIYQASSQTISPSTTTRVNFDSQDSDHTKGAILTVDLPNNEINVEQSGTYIIEGISSFEQPPDGTKVSNRITVGGEDLTQPSLVVGASENVQIVNSAIAQVTSPPTAVYMYTRQESNADQITRGFESTDHLSIARIG